MKTGWIIQSGNTNRYIRIVRAQFIEDSDFFYAVNLQEAYTFSTRGLARQEKDSWERVRKVELNEDGTAKQIIKGR